MFSFLLLLTSRTGLLLPQTTVLNQFGFVLFIGVAIDTFIVRTVIVPAAVTAFSFSTCWSAVSSLTMNSTDGESKEDGVNHSPQLSAEPLGDGHEKSVWRGSDSHVNWWPYIVPRVVLSATGEEEALWAGYDNPSEYVKDFKLLSADLAAFCI
jgi:MMPL family